MNEPAHLLLLPLVFIAVPALILGVLLLMLLIFRRGSRVEPLRDPYAPLTLHARVYRPDREFSVSGQFDSRLYGMLTIRDGTLFWDPEQGDRWSTPIGSITVLSTLGAMGMASPHLDIDIEGSGRWRLVVSNTSINRFMSNDFKRFREAAQAKQTAEHLIALGARSRQLGRG